MAVSKVVLGDETLVDLTSDTVSENTLLEGATAHAANGEQITGGVVVTPMYTGTKTAIEEAIALGQIPEDAVVNITDDEETSSFQTQINEINSSLNNIKNFPDFTNIIDSTSLKTYNAQYTATQDCYICGGFKSSNGNVYAHIYIDNVSVASTNTTGFISVLIPVGKGSVVKTRDASNTVYDLTVYGVK